MVCLVREKRPGPDQNGERAALLSSLNGTSKCSKEGFRRYVPDGIADCSVNRFSERLLWRNTPPTE